MLEVDVRRVVDGGLVRVNLAGLAMSVRGRFIFPTAGSRGPVLVVQCADVQDAMECLDFALRKGVLVSMCNAQDTGDAWGACDGGIAVDLSLPVTQAARSVMGQSENDSRQPAIREARAAT